MNKGSYATRTGLNIGTRLLLLGFITSTVLRTAAKGNGYLGLGRVVKASALAAVIEGFVRRVQPDQRK